MAENTLNLLTVNVANEQDVVGARQRARVVAEALKFESQEQTRIATACSEIVRNAFRYAGGAKVVYELRFAKAPELVITVSDNGPGIPHIDRVLAGDYRSETGLGMGITGAKKLMDSFEIETAKAKGTTVRMSKALPRRAVISREQIRKIVDAALRTVPQNMSDELQRQNHEVLETLQQLQVRQVELERLNRELDDTNRGVVALYAELDQRAELLQRASELKTRFLSNMSHEFRTPLNSILSLSNLLLDRVDGELSPEQEKQVTYIRRSAESLLEMVNDLLDIAKIEAGKVSVRPEPFTVSELFGALRGVLRPLTVNSAVNLIFEQVEGLQALNTDETKVSQILRNLISNALKFTRKGEVRVTASAPDPDTVVFEVVDTGVGIAPENLERIFEEFTQVENEFQSKFKGTGLGLPLTRKLAELLGGKVTVASKLGEGSRFTVIVPRRFREAGERAYVPGATQRYNIRALVVDDDEASRYTLRSMLASVVTDVVEAENGREGLQKVVSEHPDIIFLDLVMPVMDGRETLKKLKASEATKAIPVVIHTSTELRQEDRNSLLRDAVYILPKGSHSRDGWMREISAALEHANVARTA